MPPGSFLPKNEKFGSHSGIAAGNLSAFTSRTALISPGRENIWSVYEAVWDRSCLQTIRENTEEQEIVTITLA